MKQVYCESGEKAINAILNPSVELSRGKGYLPKYSELTPLMISGGFASKPFCGSPNQVSLALKKEIEQFFGTTKSLSWLIEEVEYFCKLFYHVDDTVKINARFFGADPISKEDWSSLSDYYHVDILKDNPDFSGFRFIKCYHGPGTQWVSNSNVNRKALWKYIDKVVNEKELTSEQMLKFLNQEIIINHDPKEIQQLEQGEFMFFKCGLNDGLVHRAPPVFDVYRIFLAIALV